LVNGADVPGNELARFVYPTVICNPSVEEKFVTLKLRLVVTKLELPTVLIPVVMPTIEKLGVAEGPVLRVVLDAVLKFKGLPACPGAVPAIGLPLASISTT